VYCAIHLVYVPGFTCRGLRARLAAPATEREETKMEQSRQMEFPVPAVAFQYRSCYLQYHCQRDPNLPMREESGYGETGGQVHFRSQPPESHHVSCFRRVFWAGWEAGLTFDHLPIGGERPHGRALWNDTLGA
jgi:hypothetical protein